MRRWILFILLVFQNPVTMAQGSSEQGESYALYIPRSQTYSTKAIADYVIIHCNTDRKKLGAIYNWVINNITYDTDSASAINLRPDPEAKITEALRRRRGVCENFAAIFTDICNKAGLVSFVVDGYTRQHGVMDRSGHTWCAVKLENKWMLCDPTWDAGNAGRTRYYLVDPSVLLSTHMPFDPLWQLQNYPVSHKQFYNNDFYPNKNQPYFNYTDSLENFINQDSLQRFSSTARRIEQHGVENTLTKNRLAHNKMYAEMIRQDIDADLYNKAVINLNEAVKSYNAFVQYRNNQFLPERPDAEMNHFFATTFSQLNVAYENISQIEKSAASYKFDTDDLKTRLDMISLRIKKQERFLHTYLQAAKEKRGNLFFTSISH